MKNGHKQNGHERCQKMIKLNARFGSKAPSCLRIGAYGCALACDDAGVGTGLRVPMETCGWGADVLGRRFCSEALAISCATCSWLALRSSTFLAMSWAACSWLVVICSMALALSLANCCWLAFSCSISRSTLARSRAIVWSTFAGSGDTGTAVDVTSCGAI